MLAVSIFLTFELLPIPSGNFNVTLKLYPPRCGAFFQGAKNLSCGLAITTIVKNTHTHTQHAYFLKT